VGCVYLIHYKIISYVRRLIPPHEAFSLLISTKLLFFLTLTVFYVLPPC